MERQVRYLVVDISSTLQQEYSAVFSSIEKEGVLLQYYFENAIEQESVGTCGILLTDQRAHAILWKRLGGVVIALETSESSSYFEGADTVLFSLENLELHIIEETFCHCRQIAMQIAQTEHLQLREIAEEDFSFLLQIPEETGNDFLLAAGNEEFFTTEFLNAYRKNDYALFGYGLWTVLKGQEPIGICGFGTLEHNGEVYPQLAYYLKKEYRGMGYAKEMCHAALNYLKEYTQFTTAYVVIHPQNHVSIRLAERLGFLYEAENLEETYFKVDFGVLSC